MLARRIVSLSPTATEIVVNLGLGKRLIALSHLCPRLEGVPVGLPRITRAAPDSAPERRHDQDPQLLIERGLSTLFVDANALAVLQPDLIITKENSAACGATISDVRVALRRWLTSPAYVCAINPASLAGACEAMEEIAHYADMERQGTQLARQVKSALQQLAQSAPHRDPLPRVLCLSRITPPVPAEPWVHELLAIVGATAVANSAASIAWESVAELNPDVIIACVPGQSREQTLAELQTLPPAVIEQALRPARDRRLYAVDGQRLLSTAGLSLVSSGLLLYGLIHDPDAVAKTEFGHAMAIWNGVLADQGKP